MSDVRKLRIFSAEQIVVPDDFPGILKNFTKEVVRNNPDNIYTYARSYFESILNARGYFDKHARDKIEVLPSHFYAYRYDDILDFYTFGDEI